MLIKEKRTLKMCSCAWLGRSIPEGTEVTPQRLPCVWDDVSSPLPFLGHLPGEGVPPECTSRALCGSPPSQPFPFNCGNPFTLPRAVPSAGEGVWSGLTGGRSRRQLEQAEHLEAARERWCPSLLPAPGPCSSCCQAFMVLALVWSFCELAASTAPEAGLTGKSRNLIMAFAWQSSPLLKYAFSFSSYTLHGMLIISNSFACRGFPKCPDLFSSVPCLATHPSSPHSELWNLLVPVSFLSCKKQLYMDFVNSSVPEPSLDFNRASLDMFFEFQHSWPYWQLSEEKKPKPTVFCMNNKAKMVLRSVYYQVMIGHKIPKLRV